MRKQWGRSPWARIALTVVVVVLAAAGSAAAFQALPPGVQVNNDPAAGIDPGQSVSGEDPTNADVVGGALVAGKPAVPWAVFRQQEAGGAHDQVFSRSFANGVWTTRGNGTVGGRSSASPQFTGSLNFDQGQDGEAPSIDFAGAGRTVPWATWYENTTGTGFGANNIFASRFDAASNKWVFAGQSRGNGGSGPNVPSLNIHTDQSAENPSVAGGSAVDPTKPGPWVTWQETEQTASPGGGPDQIFVSKPIGPGAANCNGVTPAGVPDASGNVPAIGGFCFQQVGLGRVGPGGADPSLNVDVTRNGIEPDIAFTGANDSVPWVVWYEKDPSTAGLANNELVFAAKAEADSAPGAGGFHWHVFGNTGNGILNAANSCAGSLVAEHACSLGSDPTKDAEDPQVAAGTMNPANPTAPWVTWDETVGGVHQVFVSRFVTTPTPHFQIVNGGNAISTPGVESTRADITFSGNTPYVSWREETPSGTRAFVGHFVNAANPTFVLDESDVPLTPTGTGPGQADVREPISSACIATPFNADGQACQGGALGTPFFLFTNGTSPRALFADAYQPGVPVTGAASAVTTSGATLNGSVNPQGAAVKVSFQFGTTTAYGQSTPSQIIPVGNSPVAFSAALTGLPAGTTIHYRAVAQSDFGTFTGADQTLTTTTPPPVMGVATFGHAKVSGTTVAVRITCDGGPCPLTLTLTAGAKHHRRVNVGSKSVTLNAGETRIVRITLNGSGKHLLATRHILNVRLRVTEGQTTVSTQTVTFRTHAHKRH
ncbi:MAG: hypothetical protein JO286_16560 [Solirubrobacterales bacterium]|nr:hypothetical protein [Solirubrobacterales bacterium]MBV9808799.1 hypothetical protein [Solirubrobacterales bacterium]